MPSCMENASEPMATAGAGCTHASEGVCYFLWQVRQSALFSFALRIESVRVV
jgi:hypothetical protein